MAWSDEILYYKLSDDKVPAVSFDSRTVQRQREETRHRILNGVELSSTYTVQVPYDVEQRRVVKTETQQTVYECRGVSEGAAGGAAYSVSSGDTETGGYTSTTVRSTRGNEAGGWTVTKTILAVTVTRGAWEDYVTEDEEEPDA